MGWMYQEPGGHKHGPVSEMVLDEMLRNGKVSKQALVSREGEESWKHPAELAEFAAAVYSSDSGQAAAREMERSASTMLPGAIHVIAVLSVLCGVGGVVMAISSGMLWLIAPSLYALVAAPFLFGFADIVLSLRRLCAKQV